MSKAQKQPAHKQAGSQRKPVIWIIGAGMIILVIGALLLFSSSEPYVPEVTGAPSISVVQSQFDYGTVRYGRPVETVVRLRNTGDEPLIFTDLPHVQVVEGCCPPQAVASAHSLRPGEEATVTLRFTMHEGMGGPHDFRLHLYTNDPDDPETTITILSNWVA